MEATIDIPGLDMSHDWVEIYTGHLECSKCGVFQAEDAPPVGYPCPESRDHEWKHNQRITIEHRLDEVRVPDDPVREHPLLGTFRKAIADGKPMDLAIGSDWRFNQWRFNQIICALTERGYLHIKHACGGLSYYERMENVTAIRTHRPPVKDVESSEVPEITPGYVAKVIFECDGGMVELNADSISFHSDPVRWTKDGKPGMKAGPVDQITISARLLADTVLKLGSAGTGQFTALTVDGDTYSGEAYPVQIQTEFTGGYFDCRYAFRARDGFSHSRDPAVAPEVKATIKPMEYSDIESQYNQLDPTREDNNDLPIADTLCSVDDGGFAVNQYHIYEGTKPRTLASRIGVVWGQNYERAFLALPDLLRAAKALSDCAILENLPLGVRPAFVSIRKALNKAGIEI